MRITDDIVSFDPGELAALTPFTQEALLHFFGERTPSVEKAIADIINQEIRAAQVSYVPKKVEIRKVSTLEEAIAIATPEKYALVLPDIDRIKAALGIVDSPEEPAAPGTEPEAGGFMSSLKSFFGL